MFQRNDYVMSVSNGVCSIQDITTLQMPGVDKKREYFLLKPVFLSTSTIYIPVDKASSALRKILSYEEADQLVHSIPDIPFIQDLNDKTPEGTYKEFMHMGDCISWIRLIKTIYRRKERRMQNGNKVTAVDSKYFKQAEDCLYSELSVALKMTRDEVRTYIASCVDTQLISDN